MTEPQPCDLLIANAYVLTMDSTRRIFPEGAVAISDGRIAAVGPAREVVAAFEPRHTIDAHGAPVHPGFVECHIHLIHTARGAFPDTMDFDQALGLYTRWWDSLTPDEDHAGSLLACLEMVRNGTTFFSEAGTSLNPDAAAAAAQDVGIRASLADPFLWDQGHGLSSKVTMSRAPVDRKRALRQLGGQLWRNKDPDALVRGYVGVYGMGTCSLELIEAAEQCAHEGGVVFAQHQSFEPEDVEQQRTELGAPPILALAERGLVDANCTFAHMNILDSDEQRVVEESGMSIVWCVSSSMVWAVGGTRHGTHSDLHRAGVPVGLGADAVNSACRFDPGLQGLLAVLSARERKLDRDALGAEDALEMLTINGARAVGMADEIGSLEPGKRADLVVRDNNLPEVQPGLDPLQSIVFAAGSKSVRTVLVNGEVVVDGGHATRVDEQEVYVGARKAAAQIMSRLGMTEVAQRWPEIR